MSAKATSDDARSNRIPPHVRQWAAEADAANIKRFGTENETHARGVVVTFDHDVHASFVGEPDGWTLAGFHSMPSRSATHVQLREVRE